MTALSRRNFLKLTQGALAVTAVGAMTVRHIAVADAWPVAPDVAKAAASPERLTQAQWGGPPPRPDRGRPPRRRRRQRWVCWWHRGRRHCGWRWH
jgi:hypothetical protein